MNYTIPVDLYLFIYLNVNNSQWFHNAKMLKPFLILLCGSWECQGECLSIHLLLGHFQPPSHGHWTPASSFSSLWGAVSSPLLPATVPASQAHSLGIPFCCGLFLHPHTQALPKSPGVSLHSVSTAAHPAGQFPGTLLAVVAARAQHRSSPAQHVNLVTSAWSPPQSPSYHLKQDLLALTIKASHSALRYWSLITTFIFCV